MNNSDFFQKFQTMAEDVQKKVLETVRQSPAKDIEQNIRGLMHQGFQKLDLVTRQEFDIKMLDDYNHVFNSMAIDEFFNYSLGKLPYRSIKFHTYSIPLPNVTSNVTINFTHNEKYTRVTEWKNLPGNNLSSNFTTLTFEEPCSYENNDFERYYPVKDVHGENLSVYKKYKMLIPDKMTFIGRCGLYAYLDMHQAISVSLKISKEYLNKIND